MITMAVVMGIGRFVYTPILPGMMEGLGISASDAGLIASANYLGYLIGAILAAGGWAQGRERAIVLAGLAASAILAAWMGFTESVAAFLAIRFLAGIVSALVMICVSTIVLARLVLAGRSDLQAVHFGGVGLGIAISGLMTGTLFLAHAQWQAGWIWSGVISAAGFLLVLVMVDRAPRAAGAALPEPNLPKDRALYQIIFAYGLFGFGYIVTATFLVAIVRQAGAGQLFESTVWVVTGLAILPSVWFWGTVAKRIGAMATLALGCFVEAMGVVASVTMGGHAGPLIGGALLGGTFMAVTALGLQAARALAPAAPRRAYALMTASFGTGQILGPMAAGYLADWTGSFLMPSVMAAIALVFSAIVAWQAGRGHPMR